jgi:hypothetical protein
MPFTPGGVVHFPKDTCAQCPLKAQCTASAKGRSVSIHPDEALLIELCQRQQTPQGRSQLRERVGLSKIGLVQTRLAQIGLAQVGPHEIGVPQIGPTQIGFAEIGLTQIGVDLRMLSSPRIPRRDSLLENSEVLLICHRVSLPLGRASRHFAFAHVDGKMNCW